VLTIGLPAPREHPDDIPDLGVGHATVARQARRYGLLGLLLLLACAGCASKPQPAKPAVNLQHVKECEDFAERSVPPEPVRTKANGRATVAAAPNAEALRTLFELCHQARGALD
jgi:hypothetical protein